VAPDQHRKAPTLARGARFENWIIAIHSLRTRNCPERRGVRRREGLGDEFADRYGAPPKRASSLRSPLSHAGSFRCATGAALGAIAARSRRRPRHRSRWRRRARDERDRVLHRSIRRRQTCSWSEVKVALDGEPEDGPKGHLRDHWQNRNRTAAW